jgi:hypothetical protein
MGADVMAGDNQVTNADMAGVDKGAVGGDTAKDKNKPAQKPAPKFIFRFLRRALIGFGIGFFGTPILMILFASYWLFERLFRALGWA